MTEVILDQVSVSYVIDKKTRNKVIDKLSITFGNGLFHVIIGESGTGKTTLLKAILGLVSYEGGIYFGNVDANSLPLDQRNFSLVSQSYVLYPHMNIFDNIAYPLKNASAPKKEIIERVYEVAEELDLTHTLTRKPRHISGGQQQRAALARALVKRPTLIAFDEPLSNVDPHQRAELRLLIKNVIKARGITALYVTHDFEEALALADVLHVMDKGQIVLSGSSREVFYSNHEVVENLKKVLQKQNNVY